MKYYFYQYHEQKRRKYITQEKLRVCEKNLNHLHHHHHRRRRRRRRRHHHHHHHHHQQQQQENQQQQQIRQ